MHSVHTFPRPRHWTGIDPSLLLFPIARFNPSLMALQRGPSGRCRCAPRLPNSPRTPPGQPRKPSPRPRSRVVVGRPTAGENGERERDGRGTGALSACDHTSHRRRLKVLPGVVAEHSTDCAVKSYCERGRERGTGEAGPHVAEHSLGKRSRPPTPAPRPQDTAT